MTCPLSRTGNHALSHGFSGYPLYRRRDRGRLPSRKGQRRLLFPSARGGTAPARDDHGEKGILRLFVPVALCSRRRARRKHWQNAARIPVPAADRLSQSAVYRAERRSNFLSAGAWEAMPCGLNDKNQRPVERGSPSTGRFLSCTHPKPPLAAPRAVRGGGICGANDGGDLF